MCHLQREVSLQQDYSTTTRSFTVYRIAFLYNPRTQDSEAGIAVMEVLIALVLITIVGVSLSWSVLTSLVAMKKVEMNNAASGLAISKIEELAAVEVSHLNNTYSAAESAVLVDGIDISFTRITEVQVNADNSRTVAVTVSSNSSTVPTEVSMSSRFALWE
jgi:Tfp pilus assembly protein PilX